MYDYLDRPYFSHSIVDIEDIAESYFGDGPALLTLAVELFHLKTQRVIALRTRLLERLSELIA